MRIILVVEDLPEEQLKAKLAVDSLGFKAVVVSTLDDAFRVWNKLGSKISAILTDVHFPQSEKTFTDAGVPNGLAIVAEAVKDGIPVAVCSSIDHHAAGYVSYVLRVLETHPNYSSVGKIPFGMDRKDWDRTASELVTLVSEEELV